MYTLKSIAKRGATLSAAFVLVVSSLAASAAPAFADALNPLTERSLTLSSSSPGWADTDGSGNSTYAPPNSGANGQKTGNYFSFKTSSAATVQTMSFQYCTKSAGNCMIPGNDATRGTDTDTTSDLNVEYPSASEVSSSDFSTVVDGATGNVKAVPGYTNENPKYSGSGDPAEAAKNVSGNFIVMYYNGSAWVPSTGWTASSQKVNDVSDTGTTKNYIILTNHAGQAFTVGQQVKVLFFANDTNYITNPGEGAFFVKINTYNKEYVSSSPAAGQVDITGLEPATDANVVDGGVTVANVMNQSIQITTKVLETMQFSVGTVDPDTLTSAEIAASDQASTSTTHGTCDPILTRMTSSASDPKNVLQLGDQGAESSLQTDKAYATHSYWRLSSNSSAGATVYYSGHTLSNTVGDEIKPIGKTPANSHPGSEQFGLAIASASLPGTPAAFNTGSYGVNYAQDRQTGGTPKLWENAADNGKTGVDNSTLTDNGADTVTPDYTGLNASYHTPRLDPLTPTAEYSGGSGKINSDSASGLGTNTALYDSGVSGSTSTPDANAAFAFDPLSDTVPAAIASENAQVVDCVTAKMRYVGNIAATTPAGIYTTKINYIAAPQY
jgi:hypothetical protein